MKLLDRPHRDLRPLLRQGAPVYLPVNPVEYHGPHLSLHNDRLVSRGLIRDLHARLVAHLGDLPLLVADDLEVGVDPVPGPGSRHTPYRRVRRLVVDACERLAELGAERVVLMTFHGSPLHNVAIQAGVQALRRHGITALAPMNVAMEDLVSGHTASVHDAFEGIADEDERRRMREEVALDFHGGFFETSMSLHYAPDTVSGHRDVPPCPPVRDNPVAAGLARAAARLGRDRLARELAFVAAGMGWYALRPFPGYTGRPDLADPEAGRLFARAFLDAYEAHALAVFDGGAPAPPVLPWLEPLTLRGRLGTVHVPLDQIATAG